MFEEFRSRVRSDRRRPTSAHVIALLALFIALSGGAYALTLPKNSVGPQQLEKNAVTRAKIKKNAVNSAKVKDGSLLADDFAADELPAGARGEPGPQGQTGAPGAPGQDATNLFAYVRDAGSADTANVQYGNGVTGVDDPMGNNDFTVTFDQSLNNCVVQAQQGLGAPSGTSSTVGPVQADVGVGSSVGLNDNQALITFYNDTPAIVDTAFMVSAFC